MNKKYQILIPLLTLCMLFLTKKANAQVTWDSTFAQNVQTCLQPERVIVKFTSAAAHASGSTLKISLPAGFTYHSVVAVTKNGSALANSIALSGANRIATFTLNSALAVNDVVRIEIRQYARCTAGTSSYTTRDTFLFTGSAGSSTQNGDLFNGNAPSLSITSIANSPTNPTVGSIFTRTYTITNGGFGGSSNIIIKDDFANGALTPQAGTFRINPSGVNYTIPAGRITMNNDSIHIKLLPSDLTNVGDGDTILENGENFVIRYQLLVNTCGNLSNFIISDLSAIWLCPGSVNCASALVSSGVSVSIPSAPNLIITGKRERTYCANNSFSNIDTVLIRNTGGIAKNVVITLNTTFGGNINANVYGYFDTLNTFYKIGRNGALNRLHTTSALSGTSSCPAGNVTGLYQIRLNNIATINTNDSIFIILPRQHRICNSGCGINSGGGFYTNAGLGLVGTYQNACLNSTLSISQTELYPFNMNAAAENISGPTNFYCGVKSTIRYTPTYWAVYTQPDHKIKYRISVTLPAQLLLDTVAGRTMYFTDGTNNLLPSARISANTFEFVQGATPLGVMQLLINVKGSTSTAFCTGGINVNTNFFVNPDTTDACNSLYPWFCVSSTHNFFGCGTTCCAQGLEMKALEGNRFNLDRRDNGNNNTIDPGRPDTTLAKRTSYLYGDTIIIYSKAIARTSVTNPRWEFAYFKTGLPDAASKWAHISTTVTHNGPTVSKYSINPTPSVLLDSVRYDLSALSDLNNNDTVTITSKFRVTHFGTTNAAFSGVNNTRWYASRVAAPTAGQQFSCGSANLPAEIIEFYEAANVSNIVANGCAQVATVADASFKVERETWPYELRPVSYPTIVSIALPPGYVVDSVNFYINRTSYNEYRYTVPFTRNGDSVVLNLTSMFKPNGGTLDVIHDGHGMAYNFYMKPSCKSINGTYNGGIRVRHNLISGGVFEQKRLALNVATSIPNITLTASVPVAPAYTRSVSWASAITNTTAITAPNSFVYLRSPNANVTIDSVKRGGIKMTPVNGFYQFGTLGASGTSNFTIYATTTACAYDSIEVYTGYNCSAYPTAFTSNICGNPYKLYVQPQTAAIQTQITALNLAPTDPSNGASADYNSGTVTMCSSFPVEMEVLSTQPGTIYNVQEKVYLPISGLGSGLTYITDSGYIEYPIGTAPRKFSAAANTAILSQYTSGLITLDLNQIDPLNFSTVKGLPGTGTASSSNDRRAILRFKFRTNCNLVSGTQWQAQQVATAPCGAVASGYGTFTSGNSLNITGVIAPNYITENAVSASVTGCALDTAICKVKKIGAASAAAGDSIRIFIPAGLTYGTVKCAGSSCPSATPSFNVASSSLGIELSMAVPTTMPHNDSMVFNIPIRSTPSGCNPGVRLSCQTTRQLTVFCVSTGTNCPNSRQNLGYAEVIVPLEKPKLFFSNFTGEYVSDIPPHVYQYDATITNTGALPVSTGDTTRIDFYWDANGNNTFDPGIDTKVYTYNSTGSIAIGGARTVAGTFNYNGMTPSATRGMFAVLDATTRPNCNCDAIVASPMVVGLPVNVLNYAVKAQECNNNIEWTINNETNVEYYSVQVGNGTDWKQIAIINPINNPNGVIQKYKYTHVTNGGRNFYRVVQYNKIGADVSYGALLINNYCNTQKQNVIVQPNPAKTHINFNVVNKDACGNYTITIANAEGKQMMNMNSNSGNGSINIAEFSSGVYFLTIKCESFTETIKLIKE